MINRPSLTTVSVPDSLGIETLSVPPDVIRDSILKNNPMVAMAGYEKESLGAREEMVTRMGYPMIGLGLNYSVINPNPMSSSSMNGKDMIMPMAKITLPIYRKKYRAMKTETGLLKSAAEYSGENISNSLEVEYYTTIQQYQDALRRVALYSGQFQLAKQTLSIMLKSYSVSGAGLTDILQVRQQTLDYELRTTEAVTDTNISIARLRQLMASEQKF